MNMVSMKNKPRSKEDMSMPIECNEDLYPYGTRINLGNDQLQALGMKDLPKVGTSLTITAKVDVIGCRSSEGRDGEDRNVELQITDMAMDAGSSVDPAKMYEKSNMS